MTYPGVQGNVNEVMYVNSSGKLAWKEVGSKLSNVIYVSKTDTGTYDGSDENPYISIKTAMDSITGNTSSNPFVVYVSPGVYLENNPIAMKEYVSIISVGGAYDTFVMALNINSNIFTGINAGTIRGFTLIGALNASGLYIDTVGIVAVLDLVVTNCKYGLRSNGDSSQIQGTNIVCTSNNGSSVDSFLKLEKGIMNINVLYVLNSSTVTNFIDVQGSTSYATLNLVYVSSINVTNGVYVNNGGELVVLSGYIKNANSAFVIGPDGTGSILEARNTFVKDSVVYDVDIQSSNCTFKFANTDISRDKIRKVSTTTIKGFGFDEFSDELKVISRFVVGSDGEGEISHFGEGGPYKFSAVVKTFDGGNFATIPNGNTVSFPNIVSGTIIYFGDTNENNFYGLCYDPLSAIDYGTGSIVWEYYDSGATAWVAFNTLNTVDVTSVSYLNVSFTGAPGTRQAVRFDQHVKSGVTENNASATGWSSNSIDNTVAKWIRVRITSNLNISQTFNGVRFSGSYSTIRSNGTRSYNGEARTNTIQHSVLGETVSSTANASVTVSASITAPFIENSFNNGALDQLFYRVIVTEDMDTSSGVEVEAHLSGSASSGSDTIAKMHLYYSIVPSDGTYDGTNSEVEQSLDISYLTGEHAGKIKKITFTDRVDISTARTNDLIYLMIERQANESGDTYAGNVVLSSLFIRYHKWQDGSVE
jgi:hypothetical protein